MNQLQRGEAAARRVFAAVDLEPTIVDEPGAVPLEGGITSVEFRNVTFAYPSTTQPVLSRISFKVEAGDFLGVMGHTGAGKTTILKLLMRYYTPDEGEVLINGQPVSAFTLDSVRDAIGFVSQEPFLFHGTVEDNVRYNIDTDAAGIEAALKTAGAWDFVQDLEEGLNTMVGDRGSKLSGGQRARVSLARAVLKAPSLLILDEASSALDAETERRIQENLLATNAQRATIAVAHRLSTIRNADEIWRWWTAPSSSAASTTPSWTSTACTPASGRFKPVTWARSLAMIPKDDSVAKKRQRAQQGEDRHADDDGPHRDAHALPRALFHGFRDDDHRHEIEHSKAADGRAKGAPDFLLVGQREPFVL